MGNYILCPPCNDELVGGEEKCCGHGLGTGIECVNCGKVRTAADPAWTCRGTWDGQSSKSREDWECSCGATNPEGALVCATCVPPEVS